MAGAGGNTEEEAIFLLRQKAAAIFTEAAETGLLDSVLQQNKQEQNEERAAATKIQAIYRGNVARGQTNQSKQPMESATTSVAPKELPAVEMSTELERLRGKAYDILCMATETGKLEEVMRMAAAERAAEEVSIPLNIGAGVTEANLERLRGKAYDILRMATESDQLEEIMRSTVAERAAVEASTPLNTGAGVTEAILERLRGKTYEILCMATESGQLEEVMRSAAAERDAEEAPIPLNAGTGVMEANPENLREDLKKALTEAIVTGQLETIIKDTSRADTEDSELRKTRDMMRIALDNALEDGSLERLLAESREQEAIMTDMSFPDLLSQTFQATPFDPWYDVDAEVIFEAEGEPASQAFCSKNWHIAGQTLGICAVQAVHTAADAAPALVSEADARDFDQSKVDTAAIAAVNANADMWETFVKDAGLNANPEVWENFVKNVGVGAAKARQEADDLAAAKESASNALLAPFDRQEAEDIESIRAATCEMLYQAVVSGEFDRVLEKIMEESAQEREMPKKLLDQDSIGLPNFGFTTPDHLMAKDCAFDIIANIDCASSGRSTVADITPPRSTVGNLLSTDASKESLWSNVSQNILEEDASLSVNDIINGTLDVGASEDFRSDVAELTPEPGDVKAIREVADAVPELGGIKTIRKIEESSRDLVAQVPLVTAVAMPVASPGTNIAIPAPPPMPPPSSQPTRQKSWRPLTLPLKKGVTTGETVINLIENSNRKVGSLHAQIDETQRLIRDREGNIQWLQGELKATAVNLKQINIDLEWHTQQLEDAKIRGSQLDEHRRTALLGLEQIRRDREASLNSRPPSAATAKTGWSNAACESANTTLRGGAG